MKKLLVIAFMFMIATSYGQMDTTDYVIEDSLYFEENPNYIGVNISPLITSIVGDFDKDVKFSLVYKRNIGIKNLRFSINHHKTVNQLPYQSYEVIRSTDTSYDARYFFNDYKSYDLRVGIEELKGYRHARLHIGADIIIGYATYKETYFERTLLQDSSGRYHNSDLSGPNLQSGHSSGEYINLGVDVSFGFDWFLSEDFLFTFQMTPQFNYNLLTTGNKEDKQDVLGSPKGFADFKLTYFDAILVYKF